MGLIERVSDAASPLPENGPFPQPKNNTEESKWHRRTAALQAGSEVRLCRSSYSGMVSNAMIFVMM